MVVEPPVTPEVNGVLPSELVDAPGKTGTVVDGLGVAVVLAGFKTLEIC
jgi:hypothetical protein